MHHSQGKILNHYDNGRYSVTTIEVQEQVIINNPTPNPNIPVIDLRRSTQTSSQPIPKTPDHGSYGKAYTKYVNSDGMNFGISISSDMDL